MSLTQPTLNSTPFAKNSVKKNEIPLTTTEEGKASFDLGFPPETMVPYSSSGIPPDGKDFNGILNQLSEHQVWTNAGGLYKFDSDLCSAIGGYSKGAVVLLDNELSTVSSTINNNTNNPNVTLTGWQAYGGQLVSNSSVLPGATVLWCAPVVPAGYLELAGQAISRTTYSALFALFGTTYGVGDGSTTFNLPDLRGEFVRGWDHGRGIDAGRTLGSYQADELKSHAHDILTNDDELGIGRVTVGGPPTSTTYQTGSTGGNETRPRNIALMYIIKT